MIVLLAVLSVVGAVLTQLLVPETAGISLETLNGDDLASATAVGD